MAVTPKTSGAEFNADGTVTLTLSGASIRLRQTTVTENRELRDLRYDMLGKTDTLQGELADARKTLSEGKRGEDRETVSRLSRQYLTTLEDHAVEWLRHAVELLSDGTLPDELPAWVASFDLCHEITVHLSARPGTSPLLPAVDMPAAPQRARGR